MENQDNKVELFGEYELLVPDDLDTTTGMGDDTNFVRIYSKDDEIFMVSEYGVGVEKSQIDRDFLNKNYDHQELIKSLKNKNVWLVYKSTNNKLREIEGKLFIEEDKKMIEILSFSASSRKLKQVSEILHTIENKN